MLIRRRDKNRRPRTCRADFLTFTCSKRSYTTTLPVRRRNTSRKAARKASVEARRLVPSDCAVWVRSWHTKDGGTAFSRFVLPTARLPFVARNELAIATKSIASVLPHAKRTPWVPSKYAEGERRCGRDALNNTSCECVVAKANEADCLANAEVQTREEGGSCI